MATSDGRYRALLDVSSAIANQPTVEAVLHSLRGVLSRVCSLHGAFLYILDAGGETLHLLQFDREADAPPIKTGTRILRVGAVAQALEEQEPVFTPDVSQEMLKHPELVPFAAESEGRGTYFFPVSLCQQRCGVLVVTKDRGQHFVHEDVELLSSLASHVAVALECALAQDSAELYQRQLMNERDRLQKSEAYLAEAQKLSQTCSRGRGRGQTPSHDRAFEQRESCDHRPVWWNRLGANGCVVNER